jgi:hypothetical protein
MHLLYCILKDREEPPTPDEIAIAAGKKQLDGLTEAKYLKKLEKPSTEDIKKAFERQKAQATVSIFSTSTSSISNRSLLDRGHGTKQSLSSILQNGSLHAINLSTKLKNLSLSR